MDYHLLISELKTTPFHIYGTGIVGISIYIALKERYGIEPVSFLVTSPEGNPLQIEKIPVQEVARASLEDNLILVAVPVEHHGVIGRTLRGLGVSEGRMIYVDSVLENQIMGDYYAGLSDFVTAGELLQRLENTEKCCRPTVEIYQAKCHVDRPLVNDWPLPVCICPIQVGADLTEQSVADLKDNTGDHISRKNRDYCELTATYYAWKNSAAAYKGLCHYRRVFALDDMEINRLLSAADVILPYPTIYLPDISREHGRYISEPEWRAMRQAVAECEPAYAADFDRIFSGRYFYNFNMLAARAEVFDDYARWLFGILERTEEIIAEKSIAETKRYAGYLGENLTTLYFRRNRGRLSIVHAGKLQLI